MLQLIAVSDAAAVIDISACDFEVVYPDLGQLICGFESVNWRQDVTSSLGPRADHTIGEITSKTTMQSILIDKHCFILLLSYT